MNSQLKNPKPISETTVVVGMSGGVDSSVSAALLKEQGYRVIGMFMKNWDEVDERGVCNAEVDYADVVKVCERLDIPYYSVEFVEEYRQEVFRHFLSEYQAGHTPNPDILCNREIKFKRFFERAMELGADYLATGHYCQNHFLEGSHRLVKGRDPNKDQTYFLYTIKSSILEKVLFPIGHLPKALVREKARELGLATHDKKDSTGICFIGERNFKQFLGQYISTKKGEFRQLDGSVVGQHDGVMFYTLGQRKGLGLGGAGDAWFVVAKDTEKNIVYVERGEEHPAMYSQSLTANELTWVAGDFAFELPYRCYAKTRYRQPDQACTITRLENDMVSVEFDVPQRAVTPRQSVVFYQDIAGERVCLGGGMIIAPGPSFFELKKALPLPK